MTATEAARQKMIAEDRTSTMLAMTHHIQTRIITAANRGVMSLNVAEDIRRIADQLAESADRLARGR
jgi:hypothetical protein